MDKSKRSKPLVTVGILNRDGILFLKQTIPQIFKLEYPNLEIIVVDNGSKDGSLLYLEKFEDIMLIRNLENKGYGHGKNQIVENSQGDYILMLDNDIKLIEEKTIEKLLAFYKSQKNIAFLSFPLLDIDKKRTEHFGLFYTSRKTKKNWKTIKELKKVSSLKVGGFIGGCVFFKKEIFVNLGMYDTVYPFNLDDYDLSARAYLQGYKILILTELYAKHLGVINRINIKTWSWKNQYSLSGFSRMMWKNYRWKNLIIWWPITCGWIFLKSLKYSLKNFSLLPITSYLKSILYFLRDITSTLELRKTVQKNRKTKEDIFLTIKLPNL